jgi:hypothetical protein
LLPLVPFSEDIVQEGSKEFFTLSEEASYEDEESSKVHGIRSSRIGAGLAMMLFNSSALACHSEAYLFAKR